MKEYQIKVVNSFDKEYVNQCIEIAKQHEKALGHYEGVLISNYIICADKSGKVLGFIGMIDDKCMSGDFYISQVAVDKEEMGKGIASELLKYVKHHSKGYTRITSDIKLDNKRSISLHEKAGFEKIGYCQSLRSFRYSIAVDKIDNNEYIQYTEAESELGNV